MFGKDKCTLFVLIGKHFFILLKIKHFSPYVLNVFTKYRALCAFVRYMRFALNQGSIKDIKQESATGALWCYGHRGTGDLAGRKEV